MKPIYLPWKENSDSETQNHSVINTFSCENSSREPNKLQTFEPLPKSSRLKNFYQKHNDFYGNA
jgi:hypothetical protein